ncbi:MAG: hypothetical protein GX304_06355 [Clostridiales bacterium]|jgi:regulator of sigma E protease|nr:hypothetical protein [Clostridiales bacterium]
MEILQQMFSNVFYIFVAILVLLFMITVHELGHYIAGKILRFRINEFSIGFGPKIYSHINGDTGEVFSLRAIPLGGFCAFEGEDEDIANPDAFNNQKPWKRIIVLLSGVAMNFLVSLLIVIITFMASGMYVPSVAKVLPDAGPAVPEEYKLKEGDLILAIEGREIYLINDMIDALDDLKESEKQIPFTVTVVRGGVRRDVQVMLRRYLSAGEGEEVEEYHGLGIERSSMLYRLGFWGSIKKGAVYSFKMAGVVLGFFADLITGGIGINQIGGPITTIGYTADWARMGFRPLIEIVILIGVNLAVFNALPIPALDGSRIMFIIIEIIRKKPIRRELEGKIHFAGLLLLLALVIIADLFQIIG